MNGPKGGAGEDISLCSLGQRGTGNLVHLSNGDKGSVWITTPLHEGSVCASACCQGRPGQGAGRAQETREGKASRHSAKRICWL